MTNQGHHSNDQPWKYTQIVDRYIRGKDTDDAGQFTLMIRHAFTREKHQQKKIYLRIIAGLLILCAVTSGFAVYNYYRLKELRSHAENTFYDIKSMEIKLAGDLREKRISETQYAANLKSLEVNYDAMLDTLDIYGESTGKEQRLILKMARTFGECELNMPKAFSDEVMRYISLWQTQYHDRLEKAIKRARDKHYIARVIGIMRDHGLPPHFFYLALQESDYDVNACGPETKYGRAKGAWQFIPSTGKRYGLRIGPLAQEATPDPGDDRHHFGRSTLAAARYLRDIYDTDAQASGLLVMASYNWGENRVIQLINSFPKVPLFDQMGKNPHDRNFWQVLSKYKNKIPRETYDYVFYIFSAAVIGEDPRLFGFDFDNPLATANKTASETLMDP